MSLHYEHIPAAQTEPHRLLVMLHGLGDSLEGYRWLPDVLQFPWLNYLLVNAPDTYYGGFSWFDFAGDIVPGVTRSRRLLFELLNDLSAKGFPSEQTIIGGFSQGCLMALEAGLRYPRRFAGILGISGYVCEPEAATGILSPVAREQRFLITHGTLDTMLPIQMVRPQIQTLKRLGLNIQWHEFAKAHTIAGQEELNLIRRFISSCFPRTRASSPAEP